ncbi:PAC2 family protein [Ilumatobacter sp.]|uniref:PAC2 family protein n=1 Tax=Ilumatobacter sp. TaxID=1967498 RepID=UPI003B51CF7E
MSEPGDPRPDDDPARRRDGAGGDALPDDAGTDESDARDGVVRSVREPALHEPVMVVMLTGWIDAAGAAAAAAAELTRACESTPILTFDDDTYIDYRARRPTMQLRDGLNTDLDWATIEMRSGRSPGGRDVVFLVGPEPDMAWRRFGRAVSTLAVELGVTQMVSLGAYPFASPHTRPSRLSVSTPSSEVLASVNFARSSVDVPAGMAAVLEHAMHARRIPALGIWAQVPHYVSAMEYPAASVALLDGLAEVTGIEIEALDLRDEVAEQRTRLDRMVAEKSEYQTMLTQLEELHDLAEDQESEAGGPGRESELEMRSGDELAREIQEFFRDQG